MPKNLKPTLKDVAKRANVSTGTVSLVLNRSNLVAFGTRHRVMQAIEEIGYVYDRGAAQLRSRRTNIVALSVCNLINPYFAEIAAAIENTLDELGYALLMGNCSESVAKQRKFMESIREYNADGILVIPARDTRPADLENCRKWNLPVVMVSRYVPGAEFDFAGTNNRADTAAATRHVIELGHSRIAFVGWNRKTTSGRDRTAGYRAAMRDAGLGIDPGMIVECQDSREDGFHAIHALYEIAEPPTAVVCFNDILAFGVMLGLRNMNLVPGKDCSVVGHDDVAEASLWRPALTTIAIDEKGIGKAAADLIRFRIEGGATATQKHILESKLIVRDTCGPPTAAKKAGSRRR